MEQLLQTKGKIFSNWCDNDFKQKFLFFALTTNPMSFLFIINASILIASGVSIKAV